MSNPKNPKDTAETQIDAVETHRGASKEGMDAQPAETQTTRFDGAISLLARTSRVAVAAIAVAGAFWATEAHADELQDAAKANNAYKVMQILVKKSGEGYLYTGPQKDGKVVQCGEGNDFMDAKKIAETKVRELLKGDLDLSVLLQILDNKKWVVCATGSVKVDPFEPELLSAPPLKPLPDPKVEIFKAMGELTREFGRKYVGPQEDGTVIQCASDKKLKKAKEKAKKQVKAMMTKRANVEFKKRKLSNGQWVVAALGRPLKPMGRTRGAGPGQSKSIDHMRTSGGGKVKLGQKGEEVKIEEPSTQQEKETQAISTDQLPKKLTQLMYRKIIKAFEGTLKQWNSFSGKVNITFHLKDGKVTDITVKGTQPYPMLVNFKVELLSKFSRVKFPKESKVISLPVVLSPKY